MSGYEVEPAALQAATGAIRRNAGHLASMGDYCESLSNNSGAFGAILQTFRDGYDTAATTQVRVLDEMRYKLTETAEALNGARKAYLAEEENVGGMLKPMLNDLDDLPGLTTSEGTGQ